MPDNVIDNLQIQIAASSTQAEDKVTALVGSLTTLKGVLNNFKSGDVPKIPRSLANNISALTGSVSKITDDHARKLIRLSSALKSISGSGEIKISSKLGENIFDLTAALDEMKPEHTENLKRLGEALGSLSGEDNVAKTFQSIAKTETKIGNITDYLYNVSRLDFSNLTDAAVATNAIAGAAAAVRSASPVRAAASAAPVTVLESGTTADRAATATGALREEAHEAKEATHEIEEHGKAHERAAEKVQRHNNVLKKLVSSFGRILLYRSLRSIIKEIGQAFAEGRDNLVRYSAAMDSLDAAKVNANMSTFATSMLYVKNSVAAAAGPMIQTLVPIIQTVANWFVRATNTVNQFFAALRGNTSWTRAKEYALDYAEGLDKAKGAAKELQKYLLPFDELNVLPSQNTGRAGSADALDYSQMFEEVGVFDENIIKVTDWLKNNFDDILKTAEAIGATLLAWKISPKIGEFVSNAASTLGKSTLLQVGLGVVLTVAGIKMAWDTGYNIGLVGWDNATLKDKIASFVSPFITAAGGALIGGAVAGVPGAIIGASFGFVITLAVQAIRYEQGAGVKESLDRFYSSDVGKRVLEVKNRLETNGVEIENLYLKIKAARAEFEDQSWKIPFEKARTLIDEIFELDAQDNKTAAQIQEIKQKIIELNSLGLGTIIDGFDDMTGHVTATKDEVNGVVDNMMKMYRLQAYQERIVEALKDQDKASRLLADATETLTAAQKAKRDVEKEIEDVELAILRNSQSTSMSVGEIIDLNIELNSRLQDLKIGLNEADGALQEAQNQFGLASDAMDEANGYVNDLRTSIEGIVDPALDASNSVKTSTDNMKRYVRDAVDDINRSLKDIKTDIKIRVQEEIGISKQPLSGATMTMRASGGFPDTGEMFIARERGPELVGRMGNRNAVANNNQIVEGISEGVEEANEGVIDAVLTIGVNIVNAIQNNKNGVSIDDIARGVTRWQNRQARALGV